MAYDFDLLQILGYVSLVFLSIYFLHKKFDVVDLLIIVVTTVLAFEIAWELPQNLFALYLSGVLVWPIVVKHIFILYPMYLWVYYTWLYGKRYYLLLFVFAIIFELIVISNYDLSKFLSDTHLSWIVRYIWIGSFIINLYHWRNNLIFKDKV